MTNGRRIQMLEAYQAVESELIRYVESGGRLAVVKAPPGSGKTHLLLQVIEAAVKAGQRVAVGAQTNAQADDICRRLGADHPSVRTYRFASSNRASVDLGPGVEWITQTSELPLGSAVVVGTTAKWGLINLKGPFDTMFVDEAWQMGWADFMLCAQVSARFVLIGDPGQIPPTVTVDTSRWETSPRAPHISAPELILADNALRSVALSMELTTCRRLPRDSVDLVQQFYDFSFRPWALPGERSYQPLARPERPFGAVIDALSHASTIGVTLSTPNEGVPLQLDVEVAHTAAELAVEMLELGGTFVADENGEAVPIAPGHIGIAATHRVVNAEVTARLPATIRNDVRVATPERWQGLQRPLMIVIHPLSGVTNPSAFDLETGRLCVMASRHQVGLVVLTRDHLPSTLATHIPSADQPITRPDVSGRGHDAHHRFWSRLVEEGRVVGV